MSEFPADFIEKMKAVLGKEAENFFQAHDLVSPAAVRLNPFKKRITFKGAQKIPWSEIGYVLPERPSFTIDPHFHAGCYYVQEPSSQFLEVVFNQIKNNNGLKILDLSAAPGGKSTHLLSMMNETDLLVSNEIIPSRNKILQHNIAKWGCSNVIVTQNDPADFDRLKNYFDIVLVDAPCSGEGLFRKDKEAMEQWSIENVHTCEKRQSTILSHATNTLKPGGYLIYCTCTYEPGENEAQVKLLTQRNMKLRTISYSSDDIVKNESGFRFYPHRVQGEGFFISLLKKVDEIESIYRKKNKNKRTPRQFTPDYLEDNNYVEVKKEERIFLIPPSHFDDFIFISENLYIRHAGIPTGTIKGKDFIPSPQLALSNHIREDLSSVSVDIEQALKYLRGETLPLKISEGWYLVKFEDSILGWAKAVSGRLNNGYPADWRIRNL
jgi:16S rRNA C967 or C1407 C5-methylase (RsmB/RsmF family)/NOL1/NOP2/fmu family ribosome biogenesis protein